MAAARQIQRQITGTSTKSVDDAIDRALVVARDQYGEPDWFEVVNTRGFINNGRVSHYQVSLELGYDLSADRAEPDQYLNSAQSIRRHRYVSPVVDRRF